MSTFGTPSHLQHFEPTRAAALERVSRLNSARYARTRNHLDGAVSGLSPYITHGLLTVPEALQALHKKQALAFTDKIVAEFAWREFFQHVWSHLGDKVLDDQRAPVWSGAYARQLPPDIREGRTGVKAIDSAVRVLYATGYLHNHARMWLASYVVHLRKVHWRVGADWMLAHLLDGDLASNHLSWQWVAGTFSSKPYLFNAENVDKFAPAVAGDAWSSMGSQIDRSYEELDDIARNNKRLEPMQASASGVTEPAVCSAPPGQLSFDVAALDGRTVELVHPWALTDRSAHSADTDARFNKSLRLGVVHLPHHHKFAWNERRWNFVMTRMREVCDGVFVGDAASLKPALASAASVRATASYNSAYAQVLGSLAQIDAAPRLLPNPNKLITGFTRFYERVQRDVSSLDSLLI
jgi:deoxyribodipyrimidine photo-lyase